MNIATLIQQKVGKRLAAVCWAVYELNQSKDLNAQILITALTVAYLTCQTVSDWRTKENNGNGTTAKA